MKRYYSIFLLSFFLGACQDSLKEGFGYLQFSSVELNKTVIPTSKATGETTEKIALDLIRDGEVIRHVDDWTSLKGESLLLPTGTYVVKAYSADKDVHAVGFEGKAYYAGQTDVKVEKDVVKPVEVSCKLAQCMVSVKYSDNFKENFKAYSCEVKNQYGSVEFVQDESRSAYFPAADLIATLSLTNTDNKSFTLGKSITDVQAQYHYSIKYDVTNEGTGDFNITVDQTTHNYIVSIVVPLTSDADPALHTGEANAWGQFAYIYGTSDLSSETDPIEFQYNKADGTEWVTVAATLGDNGVYSAKTAQLDFGTTYHYRIACGAKVGAMSVFTTEDFQEVPNLNFDTWTQSGKNWYANADAADSYWASGNSGVTSFLAGCRDPITVRVEGDEAYRGYAAKMSTITGVTLVTSAAGNLFIGTYKTNMTNPAASVSFGRPYTGARPVKLSGYYKYEPHETNEGSVPSAEELPMDECNIYIRLWDADDNEIGFGEFVGKEEVTTYTRFEIDVKYSDETAKPAKMTIVATSSRYGGDFSGSKVVGRVGAGSTLWVDEFELTYYK